MLQEYLDICSCRQQGIKDESWSRKSDDSFKRSPSAPLNKSHYHVWNEYLSTVCYCEHAHWNIHGLNQNHEQWLTQDLRSWVLKVHCHDEWKQNIPWGIKIVSILIYAASVLVWGTDLVKIIQKWEDKLWQERDDVCHCMLFHCTVKSQVKYFLFVSMMKSMNKFLRE